MKEYIAKQQQSKQTERTSIVGVFTVEIALEAL
jgi:hypothetical protein